MSRFRLLSLGTALVAALSIASATQAASVTYLATGNFYALDGTTLIGPTYDNGSGAIINFVIQPTNDLTLFPSNVSFGSFLTAGTTGTPTAVDAIFRLTITQLLPDADELIFEGKLSGLLGEGGGTTANIQFTSLTKISASGLNVVTYSITNGSDSTAGKINIAAPDAGGTSTIEGRVQFAAVPEPSAIALLGLAAPAALAFSLRRRGA